MKKICLTLVVVMCCILATPVAAQLGVKAGVNFSAVGSYGNSEEGETASLKPGFQLGLTYGFELSGKVSLLTELNYERRGTVSKKDYMIKFPVQDPTSGMVLGIGDYAINQEANSQQHYINLPVLFVFGSDKFKYYIGPNIGYMISGNAEFDRTIGITLGGNALPGADVKIDDVDWYDYDSFKAIFVTAPEEDGDFLNRFELGINLGAMYYLTDVLFADLRISQGLTDTSNNHYDNSIYPDSVTFQFESREDVDRNLSIQLSFGFQF